MWSGLKTPGDTGSPQPGLIRMRGMRRHLLLHTSFLFKTTWRTDKSEAKKPPKKTPNPTTTKASMYLFQLYWRFITSIFFYTIYLCNVYDVISSYHLFSGFTTVSYLHLMDSDTTGSDPVEKVFNKMINLEIGLWNYLIYESLWEISLPSSGFSKVYYPQMKHRRLILILLCKKKKKI